MLVGEWLAVATNTNAHTYEVAPVFTLAEIEVLAKMARIVGGAYADVHDGLFVPGGSIANLYGAAPEPSPFEILKFFAPPIHCCCSLTLSAKVHFNLCQTYH